MQDGGYRLEWWSKPEGVTGAFLVIADLEGDCRNEVESGPVVDGTVLAATDVAEGRVLPFVHVRCSAVRQFLAPVLPQAPKSNRLYARALGRVLAHELYHVLGRTTDHTKVGVTRASVKASDLVSDRFRFGSDAVDRIRPLDSLPAATSAEFESAAATR